MKFRLPGFSAKLASELSSLSCFTPKWTHRIRWHQPACHVDIFWPQLPYLQVVFVSYFNFMRLSIFHPLLQSLLHLDLSFLLQGISLESETLFVFFINMHVLLSIKYFTTWSLILYSILLQNWKLKTSFCRQRAGALPVSLRVIQKVCLKRGNCIPSFQVLRQHCFSIVSFITIVVKKYLLKLFLVPVWISWLPPNNGSATHLPWKFLKEILY